MDERPPYNTQRWVARRECFRLPLYFPAEGPEPVSGPSLILRANSSGSLPKRNRNRRPIVRLFS